MRIIYDPDKDIMQIALNSREVVETAQVSPNLVLDYDDDGLVIGLELRRASTRIDNPMGVAFAIGQANLDKPQPYSAQDKR
jgi:uncharacterized protein YuzE